MRRQLHKLETLVVKSWCETSIAPIGLPAFTREHSNVVLMGDVLEHLVDPLEVLVQLRPLLDSNASLVICLPNVVHWCTRLKILVGRFEYESIGTLDHTHLRFYTVKTAREMIESAGYRITKFHPAIGGRLSGYARPVWQWLAHWFPGLFAFQVLYQAKPQEGNSGVQIVNNSEIGPTAAP